jgi:hypothetical protein
VKEHDVRAVALVLMVRAALEVVHRPCSSCRGIGEVLVAQRRRRRQLGGGATVKLADN